MNIKSELNIFYFNFDFFIKNENLFIVFDGNLFLFFF